MVAAEQQNLAKQLRQAENLLRQNPNNVAALQTLGVCMLRLNRMHEAIGAFQRAVDLQPHNAGLHFNLAALLDQANDRDRSLEHLEIGLRIEPGHIPARRAHVATLIGVGRYEAALSSAREILRRSPGDAVAQENVAQALHALREYEAAEQHVRSVLAENPLNYGVLIEAGYLSLEAGEFDSARRSFESAVKVDPGRGAAFYGLTLCSLDWRLDHELLAKMQSAAGRHQISPEEHAQLQFALGKVFEEFGEFRRSMEHYDQANRVVLARLNATRPFDIRRTEAAVDRSIDEITTSFLEENRSRGNPSSLPLLVFGMPRSGTTLVEQILASHPDVAGAGELPFWTELKSNSVGAPTEGYLKLLGEYGPTHQRVVDKYPGNFMLAGNIHAHYPKATMVHVNRNPLDTCLSLWSTYLPTPPGFAANRTHIVQFYRQYLRIMDHWRSVLPPENLIEIEYEALIANPEPEIRRLIAACGLDWNDACLHPERRPGRVTTATVSRVRVPIDATRVARWQKFEPWLGEFDQLREVKHSTST